MKIFKILAAPLALSLFILWVCYPGFMSYDSVRMLEEARSYVRGGIYPAMPVYILRFFDMLWEGPTLMLWAQNLLLLLSLSFILRKLGVGVKLSALILSMLLLSSTVIGCMLVLWKDVTMASLVVFSVAVIFWADGKDKTNSYYWMKWIAFLSLMLATAVRLNAITLTMLVIFYWLAVFYDRQTLKLKVISFVTIFCCFFAGNTIVNGYNFPQLNKLAKNNLVYAVMLNDVLGISAWSRDSLIPISTALEGHTKKSKLSDIDRIYSSLGAVVMAANNTRLGGVVKLTPKQYTNEDIFTAWRNAIYKHPLAYFQYRWDLFSEIIGATGHRTYEPTHFGGIDVNQFGIELQHRSITTTMLHFIAVSSNIFIGKPWFIFILSILAVFFIFKNSTVAPKIKALSYYSWVGMLLYILPFFIISGTGEVRYSFPSIVLSAIPIFVWISTACGNGRFFDVNKANENDGLSTLNKRDQ